MILGYSKLMFLLISVCVGGAFADTDDAFDPGLDLNADGKRDIFYEKGDDGYYFELLDTNFDGKVDESNKYDGTNRIVSSRLDQNNDGYLETGIIYKNGSVIKSTVDADYDFKVDMVFYYEAGHVICGVKFYSAATASDKNQIGRIKFKFGYPIENERLISAQISKDDFDNSVNDDTIQKVFEDLLLSHSRNGTPSLVTNSD